MSQRRLAWTIWGISVAAVLISIVLDASVPNTEVDVGWYSFIGAGVLLYATVGALITSRQMGNRVGLLFAWVALSASMSAAAGSYASLAFERDLPFVAAGAWVGRVGFTAMIGPLAFLFLIFPDGVPVSRGWAWLMRVMLLAYAITVLLFAVTPGPLEAGFAEQHGVVENPVGLPAAWEGAIKALTTVTGSIVFVGAIVSVLSLIQRYRHAASSERQRIRWLAALGAFTGAYLVIVFALELTGLVPEEGTFADVTFVILLLLIFVGIPVTCAVAILKHGLWDLDVVVKRTAVFVILVGMFTVLGIVAAALASQRIVESLQDAPAPLLFFGVAAGALILPLYRLATRIADRIVFKGRADPYQVLTEFSGRVGGAYDAEDVLPRMARILGEATRARTAHVWLRVGRELQPAASWPPDAPARQPSAVGAAARPDTGGDVTFEVRDGHELLGALSVEPTATDPMTGAKERLIRDLADQARLVLRNVRLIEELRASRQRLVAAQDEERRRLERNIHDGAQQQLVALQVKQRLADSMIERDPAKAHELMAQLQEETATALDDLRDLARGIYPPLLADQGLAAALGSQVRRSPIPVDVEPDGIGRYPQEIEAAVYFSCLEALQNVAKYAEATEATVRLSQQDGVLRFEVSDDGRGFDPSSVSYGTGLRGIADRLEAIGGRLDVRSAPGRGTSVGGAVPVSEATAS